MPLSGGQTFGGYRIIRLLGSGGMGEVYLAEHPRLPRSNALKVLPADISGDPDYRARFNREADLASKLWHPHIVSVHDRGEYNDQLWISMDYVDGLDAARLLANRYPAGMPTDHVVRIVTAVASALDYAHKQGLLHRDVKPANIMLTHLDDDEDEQRVLLTDFGIARTVDDISGLTATNMTVGTVAYSAPEQLLGEELDGRADQYALAATAYHLLTGRQLFPHSNPAVVISHHLNAAPPALADTRAELAALDSVLSTALAKEPDDRFPRCSDFARALANAHAHPSVQGPATATDLVATFDGHNAPAATAGQPTQAAHGIERPSDVNYRSTGPQRAARLWIGAAVASVVIVVVAGVAVVLLWPHMQQRPSGTTAPTAAPSPTTSTQPKPPAFAASPTRLPFTGLQFPKGLAVDRSGNVYVADDHADTNGLTGRILKLTADGQSQTELPFSGLDSPCSVAVGAQGDIYVLDSCSMAAGRLFKLAAGSTTPTQVAVGGGDPTGGGVQLPGGLQNVAVDAAGNVYTAIAGRDDPGVYKLTPGSTTPTRLPFTLPGLPQAVAVDTDSNVYVSVDRTDSPGRVFKLTAASNQTSEVPVPTGVGDLLTGLAVDQGGDVYLADVSFNPETHAASSRVLMLGAGSTGSTELPFPGLSQADGLAVGTAGVYVTEETTRQGQALLLKRAATG
jgi:serine/threonine protein kinase